MRAEATKMLWEIAGAHGNCLEVQNLVPEPVSLAGGDWVQRIPRALADLRVGLYNPIDCPSAVHIQLQFPPAKIVMPAQPGSGTGTHAYSLCCTQHPGTGTTGRTSPSQATMTRGGRRCRSVSTGAPRSPSTTAAASNRPLTTPDGTRPRST